mmetsp:Transcript_26123/g.60501  ORF Transcript_26123/g.60501 Transcript_26123/m.60501 type:complete len:141 (+) Transcript_26123:63-485(+)
MGCATSAPNGAATPQLKNKDHGHQIDWNTVLARTEPKKKADPQSDEIKVLPSEATSDGFLPKEKPMRQSWHSLTRVEDCPVGSMIEPNRKLHEKHVRKLTAFLADVDVAPYMFKRMVHCKRLHDFGDSCILDHEVAQHTL